MKYFDKRRFNCPLPKFTERLGLSSQNDHREQCFNTSNKRISILALLSGIVLGGQTQSLREFQEWVIALYMSCYFTRGVVDGMENRSDLHFPLRIKAKISEYASILTFQIALSFMVIRSGKISDFSSIHHRR